MSSPNGWSVSSSAKCFRKCFGSTYMPPEKEDIFGQFSPFLSHTKNTYILCATPAYINANLSHVVIKLLSTVTTDKV